MIRTEAGYESTHNALATLELSLASMTRRRAEYGQSFYFFTSGVVEEILKLRAEIDEYTGLAAFLKEFGVPPPDDALIPPADGPAGANGSPADVSPPAASPSV